MSERPTQRDMDPIPPRDQVPTRRPAGRPLEERRPTQEAVAPPARRPAPPQRKRIADIYQEMEEKDKKPERKGIKYTLIMGTTLLLGLGIFVIYEWQAGLKQEREEAATRTGKPQESTDE